MKKISIIFVVLIICGVFWFYVNREPSLTLIFPNGGEILKEGSIYNIAWETDNIPPENKIAIHIRRVSPPPLPQDGQEFDPVIFINLENTGSKEWTVGAYPEGNYILEVVSYESVPVTDPFSDESDASFEIIK